MQRPSRDAQSIASSVVHDDDDESTIYSTGGFSYYSQQSSVKATDNNKEFYGTILKHKDNDDSLHNPTKPMKKDGKMMIPEEDGTEATRSITYDGSQGSDHSSTYTDEPDKTTQEAAAMESQIKIPKEELHRYALYVAAPCPFSCRPWAVVALYGLPVNVIKVFPAIYDQGWFFSPTNDGEADLVHNFPQANYHDHDPVQRRIQEENKEDGEEDEEEEEEEVTHLKEVYYRANPDFEGATSVPLLWDAVEDTAISNASVGVSEMLYQHLKPTQATRNQNICLFPNPETEPLKYRQHAQLVEWIHAEITQRPYQIFFTQNGIEHDEKVTQFYKDLRELEQRIQQNGKEWATMKNLSEEEEQQQQVGWLMPPSEQDQEYNLTFADLVFWITLIRMDLAYQWRFGMGQYSIREDFPGLQRYMQRIFAIEGAKECVLPRDIMAGYFMSRIWTDQGNGRNVPMMPYRWGESHGF